MIVRTEEPFLNPNFPQVAARATEHAFRAFLKRSKRVEAGPDDPEATSWHDLVQLPAPGGYDEQRTVRWTKPA